MQAYSIIKKTQFILDSIQRFQKEAYANVSSLDVLDLGCGKGEVSQQIAANGHNVLGVDINSERIALAKSRTTTPRCRFSVCDVYDIGKFGVKFNVIVFSEVIEHIKEGEAALRLIRDLLTTPGQMILTTPNAHGPYELMWERPLALVLPFIRRILGRVAIEGGSHINLYTYESINMLLAKLGFSVHARRNSDFISFFPTIRMTQLAKWDCKVVDALSPHLSSGWYFDCRL
jgi:2-polyprenyl-3-methyl-5-hydroxy-6-metoxy-1,4-benzoquinol methylase